MKKRGVKPTKKKGIFKMEKSQLIKLQHLKKNKKEHPWREKKVLSIKVAESFQRIGMYNKATKIKSCGSYLQFLECPEDGYKKLIKAHFCKDRLCPICSWQRTEMFRKQLMMILHVAHRRKPSLRYIFLTLTVKNCKKEDLVKQMDLIFEGFHRLFKYKRVDNVTVGWIRALEVTRNNRKWSKSYDTYHPHFHAVLAVNSDYFKDGYIKKDEWVSLWKKALKLDYEPIVDVRVIKPKSKAKESIAEFKDIDVIEVKRPTQIIQVAVVETVKYTVKDTDYIRKNPKDTDNIIAVLTHALRSRRLIGFGKTFKEIKNELNLKDVEDADIEFIEDGKQKICNCPVCGTQLQEALYKWHIGYKEYLKQEQEETTEEIIYLMEKMDKIL